MKIDIAFLLIVSSFCGIGQTNKPITKNKSLTVYKNVVFEHFDDVQVFQYFNDDSLAAKITHSQKNDVNGNVIAEYYKNYNTDKGNGRIDVLELNEYNAKNQLVISTSYYETFQSGEVQKTFYYYKDTLLVRAETFEFKKRMKPNVDKGLGRPSGCFVSSEDYQKKRTWKVSRIVLYEYDSSGRKILSYSPIHNSSHNRFEYQYDSNDKLIVEKSMEESRLLYTVNYSYFDQQTISNLKWSNQDWSGTKRIKSFDINGKLINESIIQNEKEWINVYKYNVEGKLVLYNAYDSDGEISLTHIYKYKSK